MDIWNKKQILTVLRVCYNEIRFFIQPAENEFKIHYILIIDQNTNPSTIEFKTLCYGYSCRNKNLLGLQLYLFNLLTYLFMVLLPFRPYYYFNWR